ncbi:hypothetical protein BCF11_2507 [Collimonas sp. PA-H2]|uniref:DUF2199 domain-containing protein n=1 Tax=Collimonas sp. PA-H2 TaxID=1881062 RepID=UPI000BF6C7CD|nr:DUF2199 domain-containing protein [Collimonas sp. PA-H2]PFH10098.1 hypothetical protein BCF11_2507 [Collimonas sp. PA-H2]
MPELVACSVCGELHSLDEIELTFKRPDAIAALSAIDREQSCKEAEDLCAIWGEDDDSHRFFVRGVLPIKIAARSIPYNIGAWIEVSKEVFNRINELWDSDSQLHEPPFKGKLANEIPTRVGSLELKGHIQLTGPTTRPNFMSSDAESTLFADQQFGVTEHQVAEYTKSLAL